MVAERGATALDRETGRLGALHVVVGSCRVPGLVDRDRARLLGDVLRADRGAGLDGRHRLDDVLPAERATAVVVGDRQRHRADLLDHRRAVATGHPGQLVAALLGVEVLLMRDLLEVEVEDVEPVVLRRRPEPDVAAHAAGARERRVEHVQRDVRRANEVDLARAGRRLRHAQPDLSDPSRDHVEGIEQRVQPIRDHAAEERRVVDPVHHDQELVQGEPAAAAEHPREGSSLVEDAVARLRLGLALCEDPLPPGPRLEDQVLTSGERAVGAEEAEIVEALRLRAHRA